MFNLLINIFVINLFLCIPFDKHDKIIISLIANKENIKKTNDIINSIIEQNVNNTLYEILLILSLKEFQNQEDLPKEFKLLEKSEKLNILFIKEKATYRIRTLITMQKYQNNSILLINNECLLPEGWLEMFINDHLKYPNDAIAATIQYYFGNSCKVKELSEGFIGKKYGKFNHVTEMIFNFAIFNSDLGGILLPKNFFQTVLYYDKDLFLRSNVSEEFWQSAFIIMEDKILRQSSKIFDYTKYLINDINYSEFHQNKLLLVEQEKLNFLKEFPNFFEFIKKRQKKIIVSLTSYPARFLYLQDLMGFIRNQTFQINKIILSLYREDMKYYNLSIDDIEIIITDKNLKPHLKYYYVMSLYRDYAIITLDDDLGYSRDTFKSLFNAYVENPNVICGRRSHLMTYKINGELRGYFEWKFQQKLINETNFNLILTNCGGSIFPPDILNINENFLPIINETITCDDLTLKYFANLKAIPHKWVFNTRLMGYKKLISPNSSTLFEINHINNDICINKLNIMINEINIKNLCVQYKGISSGAIIYLFDIHNRKIINNILNFDLYAYSYCPIDDLINFTIYFDNYESNCYIKQNKLPSSIIYNKSNNLAIATCYMKEFGNNPKIIDFDYFPFAVSKEHIIIKLFNYRKYLTNIFKDFICEKSNNKCILFIISLQKINIDTFSLFINNNFYSCKVHKTHHSILDEIPKINKLKCYKTVDFSNKTNIFISGVPTTIDVKNETIYNNNLIPSQFIISRIVVDNENKTNKIIIIGKMVDNLKNDLYNFSLKVLYPKATLDCYFKPNYKTIRSKIYCNNDLDIDNNSKILIENQIIYSMLNKEEILLINEETLIKLKHNEQIKIIEAHNKLLKKEKHKYLLIKINIILIILILVKKSNKET